LHFDLLVHAKLHRMFGYEGLCAIVADDATGLADLLA
jgi:hypothetical protein